MNWPIACGHKLFPAVHLGLSRLSGSNLLSMIYKINVLCFTTYFAHFTYHYPSLCTKILGHIQDADAVQALLRLLLRFTRNHKQAQLFAENNGLHHVMHLKEVLPDLHFPDLHIIELAGMIDCQPYYRKSRFKAVHVLHLEGLID